MRRSVPDLARLVTRPGITRKGQDDRPLHYNASCTIRTLCLGQQVDPLRGRLLELRGVPDVHCPGSFSSPHLGKL